MYRAEGVVAIRPASTAPAGSLQQTSLGPARRSARTDQIALWTLFVAIIAVSLAAGVRLRTWIWVHTDSPHPSMRFYYDINNAYHWGTEVFNAATVRAAKAGGDARPTDWRYFFPAYLSIYDQVVEQHPEGQYQLDYTPARLLVAALWVRHERIVYPWMRSWVPQYDYTAPLLWLNNICELLSAIGAFLLVRHWLWRGTLRPIPLYGRGAAAAAPDSDRSFKPIGASFIALFAALLIWFNPPLLVDGHIWPQWEVWLLPFFFFAAWLVSKDWWFVAGVLIPIGIMMKGQLSMVMPFFILWPLLEGRPLAALRFVGGCTLILMLIVTPWLIHGTMGWYKVSFEYPTHHWNFMFMGSTSNLASILGGIFGWQIGDPVFTIRLPWSHVQWVVSIKSLMVAIYTVCLVLCAWGAARKSRRNDPTFLLALSAPWILMFALLPQMHERYLIWGSVVTATTIALGSGWGLMHVLITAMSTGMVLAPIIHGQAKAFIDDVFPAIAWAVLLCAAIYLYAALAPNRKIIRIKPAPAPLEPA